MKLTKNQILEHSFVISIDEERLNNFYLNMKKIDFTGIKHVFGRLDSKYAVKNINLTTRDIILYAKKNNFPLITIFEDDAYPIKNFNLCFNDCINNLPDDARCISLGYNRANSIYNNDKNIKYDNFQNCKPELFINEKLIKKCWGSHSYILFNTDYDRLIEKLKYYDPNQKQNKTDIDYILHKDNDYFYVKRIPLFVQRNKDNIHNVHNAEGNDCSTKLNKLFNLF